METPLLTIDSKNFTVGESSSIGVPDKGYDPLSYGTNYTTEKGTLYFQSSETDRGSTTLVNSVIAQCPDPDYLGYDQYILDLSGNFYTLNGSTFTKKQTDSTNTYALGTTDMLVYKGEIYATNETNIAKLTSGMAAITATWWTTTRGHSVLTTSYRHPLEVVEDTMYIGDKNKIHTWDGTTSVANAMTLPTDVNIVSLRKHPDGQHLIAFCGTTADYSHTRGGRGRIYLIDTVNLEYIREIQTESQIEGTRTVGGIVYVTYGDKLGYFNGDGIVFLRDLTAGSYTYSHQISNAEDTLLLRDGSYLLAYSDIGGGGNAWYRPYKTEASSYGNFTAVGYKGNGVVLLGYINGSTKKIVEVNLKETGVNGLFYTNKILLGSNIAIRRIEVDHTITMAAGTVSYGIYLFNDAGEILFYTFPTHTNIEVRTTRIDLDIFTDSLQMRLNPSSGIIGFKQIRFYGESIE